MSDVPDDDPIPMVDRWAQDNPGEWQITPPPADGSHADVRRSTGGNSPSEGK